MNWEESLLRLFPLLEGRTVQINLRSLPVAQTISGLRSKRRGEVSFWDSSFGEALIPSLKEHLSKLICGVCLSLRRAADCGVRDAARCRFGIHRLVRR